MSCDVEPQEEHRWLQQFVGEWTYESACEEMADQPPQKFSGTESIRMIGDLWILGEGQGVMPDGQSATMLLTLGYDPQKQKYVGTWVGSMMTHLWIYEGTVDQGGKVLALESDGPDMTDPSKTARYRDSYEFRDKDHRVMSAAVRGDDGHWSTFMTTHYHRK